MRRLRFVLVVALLVMACGTAREWRAGNPGRFVDARLFPDGTAGLITFHRALAISAEYAPRVGGLFPWAGGTGGKRLPIGLVSDRHYIGLYDLATSTFRVLVTKHNTERLPDQGTLRVSDLEGTTALIFETGEFRNSARVPTTNYLLYTKDARLIPVPIHEELAQRGVALVRLHLVNADGTLALETRELSHSVLGGYAQGVAVRYPSGEYVQLSESAYYRDRWQTGDEIVYELNPAIAIKAFNVRTRATRDLRGYPAARRSSSPVSLRVHDDNTVRLDTETASDIPIISAPLPIDTAVMK